MDNKATWFNSGQAYQFYGVDGNCFKLSDRVLEAKEDEADGYRSYLDSVVVLDTSDLIFARAPLDTATIIERQELNGLEGYVLVGSDGHEWLRVGTGDWDDYYPYFVFEYTPKQSGL